MRYPYVVRSQVATIVHQHAESEGVFEDFLHIAEQLGSKDVARNVLMMIRFQATPAIPWKLILGNNQSMCSRWLR
jgi:hypothetical protein